MSRARDTADQINRINSSAADATAITVDSSENILAGKTSADFGATAGLEFRGGATDTLFLASDGNKALALNRNTSDGEIIRLSKSDSTVGTIGTIGSDMVIGSGNTGLRFYEADNSILPSSAAGQASDGTLDIGDGSFRWKDAYLSGGVYLGGTGSANKLDDYEYGSWTPTTPNAGSVTPNNAVYTKIGDQVTVWCLLTDFTDRSTATSCTVRGLPFNATNSGVAVGTCMCQYVSNTVHTIYMAPNSGLQFYKSENNTGFTVLNHSNLQSSSSQIYLMATYTAA